MKRTSTTCLFGLVIALGFAALTACAGPPGKDIDVYHVGNSLTRNLSLGRLRALFASAGGSYDHGTRLGGGKKLYEHLAKRLANGKTFRINTIETKPYGDYDHALQKFTFDALVLQPSHWWLTDHDPDNDIEKGALEAASGFIDYALGKNPAGHTATRRFYIYGTWPSLSGIARRKGIDADGDGLHSYREFWAAPYDPDQGSAGWTMPNRDFLEKLVRGLNAAHPDLAHPVRLIPAGDVFAALDAQIRAGKLPGVEAHLTRKEPITVDGEERPSNYDYYVEARRTGRTGGTVLDPDAPGYTGFERKLGILNVYADRVHMNDQPHNGDDDGTLGGYIASLTFYAVLSGESPVGLTAEPWERIDPERDAELVKAIQRTVWQVVSRDALTGVAGKGEPETKDDPTE